MLERLADAARLRPARLLAGAGALAAVALVVSIVVTSRLSVPEMAAGDRSERVTDRSVGDHAERDPDLVVRISGAAGESALDVTPVLDTLRARALADQDVESVAILRTRSRVPAGMAVRFREVGATRQESATRGLLEDFDAGTLQVSGAGRTAVAGAASRVARADARDALVLSLPVVLLLALALFAGTSILGAGALAGLIACCGSIAILALIDRLAGLAAPALAAAAVVAIVLSIEFARLVLAVRRDAAALIGEGADAKTLAVIEGGEVVAAAGATALAACVPGFVIGGPAADVAVGCVTATVVATAAALLVLPAALVLGAGAPRREGERDEAPGRSRSRRRMALSGTFAGAALVALALGAVPLRDARPLGIGAHDLPPGTPERQAERGLARDLGPGATAPVVLTARGASRKAIRRYVRSVRRTPGVAGARLAGSHGDRAVLTARLSPDAASRRGLEAVDALRRSAPARHPVTAGGQSARFASGRARLSRRVPWGVGAALLAVVAAIAAVVVRTRERSQIVRALPVAAGWALATALAALAAAGLASAGFDGGFASGLLDQAPGSEGVHLGPLLTALLPAAVIGAGRSGAFASVFAEEMQSGLGPSQAASLAGTRVRRAALAGTALAGAPLVALAIGADLDVCRQFAAILAAALLLDLLLLRTAAVPGIARLLGRRIGPPLN